MSHRFIDDGNPRRSRAVLVGEVAALEQWNSQGPEVVGIDIEPAGNERLRRLTVERELFRLATTEERAC